MRGNRGSSKADTLVKVTLVFFISLLSFSVGTFVGKQVSDSEHRKIALEGEYKGGEGGREVASEPAESEHGEEAGKISEKEVASLTEEFVNKESEPAGAEDHEGYKTYARKGEGREIASEKPAEHAAAEPADKHGEKHEAKHGEKAEEHAAPEKAAEKPAEAVHKLAEKINEGAHHVAEKVTAKVASNEHEVEKPKANPNLPAVESATVGKFTVQVASFADEKDAKARAEELKAKGYESFYLSAAVNGKTWYRVLLGMFPTVKKAEEYRAKLIKEGGIKAAIVQKIVQ